MKKRALGLLLALCLLFSGCAGMTSGLGELKDVWDTPAPQLQLPYVDPHIETPFQPVIWQYYYDQLSAEEQLIYRSYLEFLVDGQESSAYIKGDFTKDQVEDALFALSYDYPQFLLCGYEYRCSFYRRENGGQVGIELTPSDPVDQLASCQQTLYQAASDLLASAAAYESLWERELYLYEELVRLVSYDYSALSAPPNSQNPLERRVAHTAYGALGDGMAVCDGYAHAFQLLCSYAGIPATTVIGMSAQPGEDLKEKNGPDHAWSMVLYDNNAYYCDATWDDLGDGYYDSLPDAVASQLPQVKHAYFNLPYADMEADHRCMTQTRQMRQAGIPLDYYTMRKLRAGSSRALMQLLVEMRGRAGDNYFFELRLDYPVADVTDEIFEQLRGSGYSGKVICVAAANDNATCMGVLNYDETGG